MTGEIRQALGRFRAVNAATVSRIVDAIEGATKKLPDLEQAGIEAARLPHAVVESAHEEIREIREEFASQTNAPPPVPKTVKGT